MKPLDPRLLSVAPRARLGAAATLLLSTLRAALTLGQALLLADVLAEGFRGHSSSSTLAWLATVLVARGAATALQDVVSRRTSAVVKRELRSRLVRQVGALGPRWLTTQRSGEIGTLVGAGVEGLDGFFTLYLPQLVLSVLVPSAVLATLVVADWRSALIVAVTLPLLPLFLALVGMHTKQQTARQWRELAFLGGHFLDVVQGLPTLRVFGRAQAQVAVLRRITDRHRSATVATLRTAFLSALVLELVATLSVAVLAVSVGFRLLAGDLDLGTALLVLLLAPEAFLPLRAVGTAFHAAMGGLTAAESAFAILELPTPSTTGRQQARGLSVRLEGVSVRIEGRVCVEHLDLDLSEGEHVALQGPSGSGKSTTLGLVLGLVRPDDGRVLLGGIDAREVDLDRWRDQLAWVPQAPHLFARSIADNIRLGRPRATDREVRAAAQAAYAEEFIDALPLGYATPLGEHGAGLSVGQQRRVAVARAFLRDAPLLLLDEPTAGLDRDSEDAVSRALTRLCAGRTVLLATHRRELVTPDFRCVPVDAGRLARIR